MRRLLQSLHQRSRAASAATLIYLGVTALLLLVYRIDVYGLIHASYPSLAGLSFLDFVRASAQTDAATLLLLTLVTQLPRLAVANRPRALFAVTFAALGVQAVFFCLALNFFGVYQTPFSGDFLGGIGTLDLHSSFSSFYEELEPARWTGIGLALVVPGLALAWARARALRPSTRLTSWALNGSGVAVVVLALLAVSPSHAAGADAQVVADLSTNPVVGALSATPAATVVAATGSKAPFSFRFDTTSKVSKAHFDGLPGLKPGKKYNVILYFIESTGKVYTGTQLNGKAVTPVLDGLEKHAIVFPRHYANYPLSANAMLNVFMSAYDQPGKKPVVQEHSHIGLTSLPEQLSAGGYRTYLTSTGMLGYANQDKYLEVRKFDRIEDMPKIKTPPYTEWVGWGLDDRAMIKPTLAFIAEEPKKPFFVAMFPVAPHHPYAIPDNSFSLGEIPAELDVHTRVKRKYLNSLHYSDAVIGELVAALEKAGVMDDTLLFIFADHGEAFYQHEGNFNHPIFLYEENVNVPFIIYNKDLFAERAEYGGVSRHVDLLPTILDLVGLPPTQQQEGISLASPHEQQLALMHTSYKEDITAIRDQQWKYVVRTNDGKEELYDLSKDALEKTNVAAEHADVAKMFRDLAAKSRDHRAQYYEHALKDFPEKQAPPGSEKPDAGTAASDAGTADAGARDAGR
jgi:arylsulfatase A-like enzyme